MGTELQVYQGGLTAEAAAAKKVRVKVEALREALYESAELKMGVSMWYGKQEIKMSSEAPFTVEAWVNL